MLKFCFKSNYYNLILLLLLSFTAKLAFVFYSAYLIKAYALHDVYYNHYFYVKTYHFLFMGLFSLSFFILPFLYLYVREISSKKIIIFCFIIQIISNLFFCYFNNFIVLFFSILGASLINVILIIVIVQIVSLVSYKNQLWVLALAHAFSFTFSLTIFKELYSFDYDVKNFLYISILLSIVGIFLAFSLILNNDIAKVANRHFTNYIFVGIFATVRKSKSFIFYLIILSALATIHIIVESYKLDVSYTYPNNYTDTILLLFITTLMIVIISIIANIISPITIFSIIGFLYIFISIFIIKDYNSRIIIFSDKIISLSVLSLWISLLLRNFLNIFAKYRFFAIGSLYLFVNVLTWFTVKILS